jgi:hypothetical protein
MVKYINHLKDSKNYYFQIIEEYKDVFKRDCNIFYFLFVTSVVNRSLSINRGFQLLTEDNNYLCAIPLMRMQIDNCIRFFGLELVNSPNDYIENWTKGEKISRLKDKNGSKLSDKLLVEELDKRYEHVKGIYDQACNFVHLSSVNLFNTVNLKPNTRTIIGAITGFDKIPDDVKKNIDRSMLYINNVLIDLIKQVSEKMK